MTNYNDPTGGASAAGNNAEATVLSGIRTFLTDRVFTHKEWLKAGSPNGCVVRNFPYTSIYGSTTSKTEFVLISPLGRRTRIEVKWQAVQGSVDEKFPYVLENAVLWPEEMIIIITAGGGAKATAIDWLATNAPIRGREVGKTIVVMRSLDEFTVWLQTKERKIWHSEPLVDPRTGEILDSD